MSTLKNPWVIIGLIMVILIGGSVWYSKTVSVKNNEGITLKAHIKGNPEATVKLVEYSDFQCPACAAFEPAVADAITTFGDKISFEYKHFPLPIHPSAELAARAAEAAGQQDAFFPYHDLLFANQTTWSKSPNPGALFVQYAKDLNLDVDKFKRHINSSMIRDEVRAKGQEARELGLTGTPTFYLNGERMSFQTYEEFKQQIANAVGTGTTTTEAQNSEVRFGI